MQKLHPKAPVPLALYNLLIQHSANHAHAPGAFKKAFGFLDELRAAGLEADEHTWTSLIDLCCRVTNLEALTSILELMRGQKMAPSARALRLIMDINDRYAPLSPDITSF